MPGSASSAIWWPAKHRHRFIRAAMAVDVTSSMTNFSTAGLAFINADYTLALSRLPDGPYIGLAALSHTSADGIATGSTGLSTTSDRSVPGYPPQ